MSSTFGGNIMSWSLMKCDPVTQQVIHPCSEMCWDVKDACLQKWSFMAMKLFPKYGKDRVEDFTAIFSIALIVTIFLPFMAVFLVSVSQSPVILRQMLLIVPRYSKTLRRMFISCTMWFSIHASINHFRW